MGPDDYAADRSTPVAQIGMPPVDCPECRGTRIVAQTPGLGSGGYCECEACR